MQELPAGSASWAVVAFALASSFVLSALLEASHRSELKRTLHFRAADWGDSQLRGLSSALAAQSLGLTGKSARMLVAVVDENPSGVATAYAANFLSQAATGAGLGARERLRYARLATKAVPAHSPLLTYYYVSCARQLADDGQAEEAVSVLREGIRRTSDVRKQARLLERLLETVREAQGPQQALSAYERLAKEYPELVKQDLLRRERADLLRAIRQEQEAPTRPKPRPGANGAQAMAG